MGDKVLNAAKAFVAAAIVAAQPAFLELLAELNNLAVAGIAAAIGGALVWLTPNKEI